MFKIWSHSLKYYDLLNAHIFKGVANLGRLDWLGNTAFSLSDTFCCVESVYPLKARGVQV